ncbi:TetR/AcrR family transcriptional regulator [Gordonia alkaliphila]|uniref:TetR/AcrR family transcriptional regulator n=1 Tax=Gordonia alkaliphila TaxID=1053547 RepID=UPI001FF5B9E6|nr:TetR/AcrR family transcriptional regulator [Gordonia alkaliphila]MCK0439310.1 TetR/AcrR family transcriptional regulator [Gordonia alkaliphila]
MSGTTRDLQRARTRETLLNATIHCLVVHGYADTTTQRIQDEAGVSRGALLHHFGSKSELLVAAIHHIADIRLAHVADVMGDLGDDPDGLRRMVQAVREAMAGPPFQAAMELWTASRTNAELREALVPAERRLGTAVHAVFDAHVGIDDPQQAQVAFESLMALVRGLEVTRNLRDDRAVDDLVLADWMTRVEQLRAAQ